MNNSKDTNQNMSDDKKKENEYIHPLVKRYYSNKAWMDIGWDYPTKDDMEVKTEPYVYDQYEEYVKQVEVKQLDVED